MIHKNGMIEVRTWFDYSWNRWNVIIQEQFTPDDIRFWIVTSGGFIEKVKVEKGCIPPTFLTLPRDVGETLFLALAEEMNKRGIHTENDHKLLGILEAQRYHLEDLRTLLKLKGIRNENKEEIWQKE